MLAACERRTGQLPTGDVGALDEQALLRLRDLGDQPAVGEELEASLDGAKPDVGGHPPTLPVGDQQRRRVGAGELEGLLDDDLGGLRDTRKVIGALGEQRRELAGRWLDRPFEARLGLGRQSLSGDAGTRTGTTAVSASPTSGGATRTIVGLTVSRRPISGSARARSTAVGHGVANRSGRGVAAPSALSRLRDHGRVVRRIEQVGDCAEDVVVGRRQRQHGDAGEQPKRRRTHARVGTLEQKHRHPSTRGLDLTKRDEGLTGQEAVEQDRVERVVSPRPTRHRVGRGSAPTTR